MEKYTINNQFLGFKSGDVVNAEEIIQRLKLPEVVSPEDVLFALCMSDIITFNLPDKLIKEVTLSNGTKFDSVYTLIQDGSVFYSSDIEGFPDADIEELMDMEYSPIYNSERTGASYMEFDGGMRVYPGEIIIEVIRESERVFHSREIELTEEWLKEQSDNPNVKYFPSLHAAIIYVASFTNSIPDVNTKGSIQLPVKEKRFSVNDIIDLIDNAKKNNKSPFANELKQSIVEDAMLALV